MTVRRTIWLLFAVFIVYGATIPFHFVGSRAIVLDKLSHLPLNPLVSPDTGRRLSIPDVVQNILLFVPFGVLGFLAGPSADRIFGWKSVRRIAWITSLGALLSVTVEGLQLLTTDRIASMGDVMSNTVGTLLGAAAAWQCHEIVSAGFRRLQAEGLAVKELRPLAAATVVVLIAFWQPFDVTLEIGTIVPKVRALQTDVWQFDGLRDEGTSVMLSAFLGMALASYLSVIGERHPARRSAAMAIVFVCFLEGSQLFIGSRMPALWDAAVAASGVVIGVAMWSAAGRILWPRFWFMVLVVATFAAGALQMLSPFEIAPAYHSFGWFPFFGYYVHTTFEALSHVIELMLLYFPLGFWLAYTQQTRRRALIVGSLVTLAIAAPIEYLQGWIVGRYPDITDVAISLLGVWIAVGAYNGQRA